MAGSKAGGLRKPPTLQDVASRANVSVAAVSQALNDTGTLGQHTRARIREVAQELGYVPNRYAAGLRKNQSMVIGYVANTDNDPLSEKRWAHFYGRQLAALVRAAAAKGYTVTVIPDNRPDLLSLARVDALYLSDVLPDCPVLLAARAEGIPLVTYDFELPDARGVTVFSGYDRATIVALDALAARGARRIGLLTEEEGYPSDEVGAVTYTDWCRAKNLEPIVVRGNYGRSNLEEKLRELLAHGVDAIFSFYEEGPDIARILTRLGVPVPQDLQIIALCLEDCDENRALGISHVCVFPDRAPDYAVGSLLEQIGGTVASRTRVELPIALTLADSTAPDALA